MHTYPDNTDNVIDSRTVDAAIAELESLRDDEGELDETDAELLAALVSLRDDAQAATSEWLHGTALIRGTYFVEFAENFAEDIGAIDRLSAWPASHIDWDAAADELSEDYCRVEFDGEDYLVRQC